MATIRRGAISSVQARLGWPNLCSGRWAVGRWSWSHEISPISWGLKAQCIIPSPAERPQVTSVASAVGTPRSAGPAPGAPSPSQKLPDFLSKSSPIPRRCPHPAAGTADTNIRGTCSFFGVPHLGLTPGVSGNPCKGSVPLSCSNCFLCSRLLKVWNQLLVRFLWLETKITASGSGWL